MAGRAGNIAPESRTQGVILSETARRPRYGGRTHFCGKTDRRNPLRNDTASSSRRHAGRDSADTKAVIRTERQRKEARRGDGVRATANKRRAMNDGRRNGRRTTSGERWTMNGKTRNDRRKTRRNTDEGGRPDKAGEMRAERNTDRGRNGQREMRAEGDAGRQEKDGRREERRGKERCGEDRQDSGVRRQKKQACATAGPTTRPEGRHTIFISARPEYASQRRESSYRPA